MDRQRGGWSGRTATRTDGRTDGLKHAWVGRKKEGRREKDRKIERKGGRKKVGSK